MKKVLFLIVLLALLSPFVSSSLNQTEISGAQKARVAASEAEIFLEASQYSIVIDTVPRETIVTLFPSGTKNKNWLYISYFSVKRNSQVTGFIASNRVEIIKEAPEESQEIRKEQQEKTEQKSEVLLVEQENPESNAKRLSDENRDAARVENSLVPEEGVKKERKITKEENREITDPVEQDKEKQILKEMEKEESDATENPAQKIEEEKTFEPEKSRTEERTAVAEAQKAEDLNLPKVLTKVSVKVPKANIRLMPTTNSSIIHQVSSGIELKHLAKTGNWHRVNLAPNEDGIVLSGYIHQNIVNEIFETAAPPPPKPKETPDPEPEITKEKIELEPGPVKELPPPRTADAGRYFWAGGGAGYTMPSQSNFAKGMNIGGTLGLGVMKHLAIELRIPYFQSDVAGTAEGLSSGRLSSLSFMLSVQARYPIKKRFVPYLVAGGDYHLNIFRLNEDISSSWSDLGFTFEESVDHTFGFHFGAGLDVFLFENMALNLDARYYTAGLSGKWTLADQNGQEVTSGTLADMTLNSLQVEVSAKFFFNPLRREK